MVVDGVIIDKPFKYILNKIKYAIYAYLSQSFKMKLSGDPKSVKIAWDAPLPDGATTWKT